jgi:Tfp pilus assembly protein PilF
LDRAVEIMERFPAPIGAPYRLESAWFTAWYRNQPAVAQALLERAGKSPARKDSWDRLRARAAIALRSDRTEEGRTLLAQALAALPTSAMTRSARTQLMAMEAQGSKSVMNA